MLFNTPVFIFLFLPIILLTHWFGGEKYRNGLLLIASLFFYVWGEPFYVLALLFLTGFNFFLAQGIEKHHGTIVEIRWLWIGIIINAGLLLIFKIGGVYFPMVLERVIAVFPGMQANASMAVTSHLPIGISFYTFGAISYLVDVAKKRCQSEKRICDFALYMLLFPKILTGPIVRYRNVIHSIRERKVSLEAWGGGARRFVLGLGKKILIADVLASFVDKIFLLPVSDLAVSMAWIGIIGYTLQIYFDFSGYTDMAIGIAQMLGFQFPENFDYPYMANSITDFWRRWHISLSSWFRDYVYIPLGGNRISNQRTYINLVLVFFLCGLWHGVSWTFVLWGLYHGAFMVLERLGWGSKLQSWPCPVRHLYTLLVVMVGWVFFRATTLGQALTYLKAMVGGAPFVKSLSYSVLPPLPGYFWLVMAMGMLFAFLFPRSWQEKINAWATGDSWRSAAWLVAQDILLLGIFFMALVCMAQMTHQAYIYSRF